MKTRIQFTAKAFVCQVFTFCGPIRVFAKIENVVVFVCFYNNVSSVTASSSGFFLVVKPFFQKLLCKRSTNNSE